MDNASVVIGVAARLPFGHAQTSALSGNFEHTLISIFVVIAVHIAGAGHAPLVRTLAN
jgi:hypothetical protein